MQTTTSVFCFDMGSLRGRDVVRFIELGLGFTGGKLRLAADRKYQASFSRDKHLALIATLGDSFSLTIESEKGISGPNFQASQLPSWGMHVVSWNQISGYSLSNEHINALTSKAGFNAGYIFDSEFVFWQSEKKISTYESFGKDYSHLPKLFSSAFGIFDIDVSKNYGRRDLFPGMWMQAAWKMWFGSRALALFPAQKLIQFPHAYSSQIMANGSVFIQLFSCVENSTTPESMQRYRMFREWIGMDLLIEDEANKFNNSSDPIYSIDEGRYPHGGVRLCRCFLNEWHVPTRRSFASFICITEYDVNGIIVHQEIKGQAT